MILFLYSIFGRFLQLFPKYKKIKVLDLEADFYMPAYNPYVCIDLARLSKGNREPELYKWLNSIEDNSTYFDIGTSYGQEVSLLSNNRNNLRVVGFDCSLSASHFCAINKKINRDSFEFVFAAITDRTGDILKIEANTDIDRKNKYCYEVMTLTLDDFCKMRNIYPTHLKIDVDGPELKVIKGAEIIFGRSELKEIFIEINNNYSEIIKILNQYGFEIKSEKKNKIDSNLILKRN